MGRRREIGKDWYYLMRVTWICRVMRDVVVVVRSGF